MCAADPYVQTPENIQNYNRYSYVLNNPLSQIDPSGHFIEWIIGGIVGAIIAAIGAVITTVIAFVAYLITLAAQFVVVVLNAVGAITGLGPIGTSLATAVKAGMTAVGLSTFKIAAGAVFSATYGGVQTAINGGSNSDILKAALRGAVTGAVSAIVGGALHGLGDGVGSMLQGGDSIPGTIVHVAAHGAAGGGMSAAQGGSFKDGFIGGLAGAAVDAIAYGMTGGSGGIYDRSGGNYYTPGAYLARTAISSVSGGLASWAGAGKFSDGAYSAAFLHVFNTSLYESMHGQEHVYDYENSLDKETVGINVAAGTAGATVAVNVIPSGRVGGKVASVAGKAVSPVVAALARSSAGRALSNAMVRMGIARPAGHAAHHIVAFDAPIAAPARQVLQKWGIGINEAMNGVFLPSFKRSWNPLGTQVHSTVHTRGYYRVVNEVLGLATSRDHAIQILGVIRRQLQQGIPFPKT